MAKVEKNIIVRGLSGKFGGQVVFRQLRDGRTIMCAVPDFSRRVLSKDQKAHHAKFKIGAAYAKDAAKTEPLYAELAAGTLKNAYNVALADFFHPPVIHSVEGSDSFFDIQASDDVKVAKVLVTILNEAGDVLEKGEATQIDEMIWRYEPGQEGRLLVEAWDLPGNVARWNEE
ncbi:MAG: hypothetical protein WBL25_07785 [Anaerolineales bacterium]